MKLTVDFSALKRAVSVMGAREREFALTNVLTEIDSINVAFEDGLELGKDIQLNEINSDFGVLSAKGVQLMLYIPDQGGSLDEVLRDGSKGKKVHVAECSTLESMRNEGRFPRYQVTSRRDGLLPVYGYGTPLDKNDPKLARLCVCKNCLTVLNYKGYSTSDWKHKNKVFREFTFDTFFETYSSYFKSLPGKHISQNSGDYPSNWFEISNRVKHERNYTCEQCGVHLIDERKLLHVHHINGVKTDNQLQNLRALCADCHKKQPRHDHLVVKHQDVLTINRLRQEQFKFNVHQYDELIAYADTATEGLLRRCENARVPIAELGIAIQVDGISVALDLAWPRSKVAVLIDMKQQDKVQSKGWTVFSVNDALVGFQQFQRHLR